MLGPCAIRPPVSRGIAGIAGIAGANKLYIIKFNVLTVCTTIYIALVYEGFDAVVVEGHRTFPSGSRDHGSLSQR